MQDLPDRNNETAIALLATRLVSTLSHRPAVVLASSPLINSLPTGARSILPKERLRVSNWTVQRP